MATPPLQGMANLLEDQGRYGDTELVHMSQPEVRGLQSLGRLTRNPETGLMEAFSIGGFFKDYVAPAALFAVPKIGPYLSAAYVGGKAGIESGNVLTGVTTALLSWGAGKIGDKLFQGVFGGGDKALSAGQQGFKKSLEEGVKAGKIPTDIRGGSFFSDAIPQGTFSTALNPATPLAAANTVMGNVTKPLNTVGQFFKTAGTKEGLKQIGTETLKNLGTARPWITGVTSGITSDLTRTPEYAQATDFITGDSGREPILDENQNFAMNTRTEPFDQPRTSAAYIPDESGRVQPIEFTDPKYSPAVTGNVSSTFLAKKGGMLDALDSITEGMEELAEQTDGDVSIEGMIKAAAEGGMMDDVKVNPMSNLKQIAMGQQRPFEGRVMGQGDGMSDEIPFSIEGQQPALLSRDEYVLPADVVAALGNGSSNAGADKLDGFLTDVREKVMGRKRQINQIG